VKKSVAVILAAGKSTRMKSAMPKVIHPIFDRPMIDYVLDAVREAGVSRMVIVVGHQAEFVKERINDHRNVEFALQSEQHGTGHAVMMCREQLAKHHGPVLVLAGDTPLLKPETLKGLLDEQAAHKAGCVIGTAVTEANQGLGRIVRNAEGDFVAIVEQKDATPEEQKIQEINTGCYAFDGQALLSALTRIKTNNIQKEYYLTDCPAIMKADGLPVLASPKFDILEAMGVNTRKQLAEVRRAIQDRAMEKWMLAGVTIESPEQTSIDPRAQIGEDTVIRPFTVIEGPAVIGKHCQLGPHAVIRGNVNVADWFITEPFEVIEEEDDDWQDDEDDDWQDEEDDE
jgi:bifunctional UDP-N-acetylglucosamine pyrophosphorylase/glucosamine-1-phosphate N-acetyltransferase